MTDLKGYKALITGGSSGLGYEMAKQLLAQGATVIITARGKERLEAAREKLAQVGDVYALPMDVSDEASVGAAAKWTEEKFGSLDMVVSNAGIGDNAPSMKGVPRDRKFYQVPAAAVREVISTNLIGFYLVAAGFVPLMKKNGKGSLLYVSTSTATITRPGQMPYGPSKAGGEAMAAIMAAELKDEGIMVNVICPGGFTDTAMAGEGAKEMFLKMGRPILTPDVLNKTISFLADPASAGICGEKLVGKEIDGWLKERGIEF